MKATNYARASYQEVYDVMTRDNKLSMFAFHTPVGASPYEMLYGFFTQFRKYKYSGVKVNIIPAAQLPADPLQISYEAGTESYIDPRDLQNPVLFHGAHGENLGQVLNMIYSDKFGYRSQDGGSVMEDQLSMGTTLGAGETNLEDWYYASMLDPSFRKYNVMNNMSLPFMSPRVHNIVSNISVQPSLDATNVFLEDHPRIDKIADSKPGNSDSIYDVVPAMPRVREDLEPDTMESYPQSVEIFTNRLTKLGWLDTFTFPKVNSVVGTDGSTGTSQAHSKPRLSPLPKLMMGVLIMPPSYRTKLAFRIVLTHYFEFARFNTSITPTAVVPYDASITGQSISGYHQWLPDEITSTASVMETNSIDSINGDVHQTVSGVM